MNEGCNRDSGINILLRFPYCEHICFDKAPFTRKRNRSTSFRIVPKSGRMKGCVQTGTAPFQKQNRSVPKTEIFCSKDRTVLFLKKRNDQKCDTKSGNLSSDAIVPLTCFPLPSKETFIICRGVGTEDFFSKR